MSDGGAPARGDHETRPHVAVHDLAAEHLALLRAGRVSAVLHHDLRLHLRRTARVLLQSRGGLPGPVRSRAPPVQVVTCSTYPASARGEAQATTRSTPPAAPAPRSRR